jgi:hypothetical protein
MRRKYCDPAKDLLPNGARTAPESRQKIENAVLESMVDDLSPNLPQATLLQPR